MGEEQKPVNDNYRQNYDRIFGNKKKEKEDAREH